MRRGQLPDKIIVEQGRKGVEAMMVPVMLKNGTEEIVSSQVLDRMLESDQVTFFRRGSGWVVVGRDAVRGTGGCLYRGRERRADLISGPH
jgi:hypothetical protein